MFRLIPILLLLLSATVVRAEDAPKDAARYRKLIEQLASPNKPPMITRRSGGGSRATFPEEYDFEAQKRIDVVRKTLFDEWEPALPCLVEALDDKRYCMTISWAEGDYNYNRRVGDACQELIRTHLEVYREAIEFEDQSEWNHYYFETFSKEWFEMRKARTLAELQIEVIDWAIEKRKADELFTAYRERDVRKLQELRDSIAKSKKPAKPLSLLRMVTSDRR